jgi:hypothetical protein
MPFQIVTGPDGKPTVQLDKPVYKGPPTAVPPSPNPLAETLAGANKALTQIGESMPSVVPGLSTGNLKAGIGAGIAGVQKLIETGDPYKALDVAGKAIRTEIEKPQNVSQKVIYSGARDLAQSALVNLPQSAIRKPGQPDSPIPGYNKPFPSFKLNPGEQAASTLIQAALAVGLTRGAITPIAARAVAIPGVASVAQKVQTAATALKATGSLGRAAVGIARASTEGAVTGAIAEGVGFTPGKDPSLVVITKVLDDLVGTSLHQPLRDLIVSKGGNNSDVEARWLAAAADAAVIGPAFGNTIAATGFVLRAAARKAARSAATPPSTSPGGPTATPPTKPTPPGKPSATPPAAPPVTTAADQALKDLQTARRQETQAKKDALGGKPDPRVDPKAARKWQTRSNKYERELKIIEQQEIAEQKGRLQEKPTNLSPTQTVDDPWLDSVNVDEEIAFYGKQLDDALSEAAKGPQPPAGAAVGAEPRTAVQPMGNVAAAGIEPPTTAPARPLSSISDAVSGQPISIAGFRGEGKAKADIYAGPQVAIAGEGRYIAVRQMDAKQYGDKITEETIQLERPLVIESDSAWRELTQAAGWRTGNLAGYDDATAKGLTEELKQLVISRGHDGLIVRVPESEMTGKTLQRVFDHDQVIAYNQPRPTAPEAAPASAAEGVIDKEIFSQIDKGLPPNLPPRYRASPELAEAVKEQMVEVVRRIAGDDVAIRFTDNLVKKQGSKAHGAEGREVLIAGGYVLDYPSSIAGDPIKEVINFHGMLASRPGVNNAIDYTKIKLADAAHEAVHVVQMRNLTSKQLRVLNTAFAKIKLFFAERNDLRNNRDMPIEKQPQAFESYDEAIQAGQSPGAVLLGLDPDDVRQLKAHRYGKIIIQAIDILDDLTNYLETLYNAFRKRGYTSIRDIFAQAAAGELKNQNLGNVLDVTRMVDTKEGAKEWALRIRQLNKQGVPGLEPYEQIAREEGLFKEVEGPRPPEENEAQRIARLTEENKQALINGDITQEDIYKLNTYQRGVSRSGATSYTTKAEELSPLVAAMSEIRGGTEARTGIQSFTVEEISKINQDWINTYGLDWDLNYSSFAALDEGMKSYELGSLNRAMTMLDEAHVAAGREAGMWLNNIGMDDATALERLNGLVTALGTVTERSVVIDRIRRRWGQLGKEMQIPRNYDIPDQPTGVVQAAIKEEVENFNATTSTKLNIGDPQIQGVLDGSVEMSEEAMAKIDAIAQTMADASVGPKKARMEFYTNVSGGGGGNNIVPTVDAFRMYYMNSLLSGPDTVRVNLYNAMFNYSYLVLSQIAGNAAHFDIERMLYSGNMFLDAFSRIPKAFELAIEAGKLGKSLYSQRNVLDNGLGKTTAEIQATADARLAPVEMQDDSLVNTLISKEEWAETSWAKLVNHAWKVVGTPFTRFSITADTFSSVIAGYSYERMLHMSRGMDLAVQNGLTRMSPEAWKSATDYSVARTNLAMKDAVVNGKTISNALLQSPYAQRFIDAVNFTDDVAVQLEPRSAVEGYRIGKAKNLKGEELDKYVQNYLEGGTGVRPLAEQMMEGKVPLGTVASIPGKIFEKVYTEPLFPNVPGTLPYQKFAMTLVQAMYRVPLNIIKSTMRALPGPNAFVDTYWRDITSADVNTQRKAEGQILVATASLGMLFATAAGGYVRFNGSGPSDPQLKQAWLKDRQMRNSIQVWNPTTGTWFAPISLNAFGPLNVPLGIVADYIDMADRATPAQRDRIGSLLNFELLRLSSMGIINQTYFSGILDIYNAIFDTTELSKYGNDQNGAYRWLQKVLPNLIPNSRMFKAIAKEIDPVLRRVNPAQPEEGFMGPARELLDNVAGNTPGYSKKLPPQLDWSLPGAPPILLPQYVGQGIIPADAPWLSGVLVFNPLTLGKTGREITDPVQKELNMLYNAGGIPNKVFAGPRAGDFGEGVFLGPVDFATYTKLFASIKNPDTQKTWHQTVAEMIETPGYLALPIKIPASNDVSVRAVYIQAAIEKFKTLAKAEFGRSNFKIQNAIRAKQERTRDTEFIQEYGTPGFLQQPSKPTGLPQFTEALR